jgi:DtxR family transcriptional regulator, Mn-dependent transcriptional regulator
MVPEQLTPEQEHALESLLVFAEGRGDAECGHPDPISPETVAQLVSLGLLAGVAGASLTDVGRQTAESVLRRHRLTEVLLDAVLKLDGKRAYDIGCQMEHDMQPEMVEAFCTLLGHPDVCPHGRRIPPGPCCRMHSTTVESQVVPLTELSPGERGRILFITPRSHERLHRLSSLGVTPGIVVELHQRRPAFCFRFEGTELAIAEDVAADIHVARIRP